jgi:response regulator RpfG family c-di-GMP phosphodiesterase
MSPAATSQPPPLSVLVIDDEEIVLVGLRETLLREGYRVVALSDPVTALEVLQREKFAVIVTDHQMPTLTGLEFLAQAKRIQPEASRILITAVLNLDMVIEAINKGEIYRFVVKPWLREELLAAVKNAAQRHELICHNTQLLAEAVAKNAELTKLNQSLEQQIARAAEQNELLGAQNQALEQNLQHSVELCVHTMQTFYPTLGTQARRVNEICKVMAADLELEPEPRRTLEISSWLYDFGLVGVPRDLIRRWYETPDSLTSAEAEVVKQHPALGEELIAFVHHLESVGKIIRAHHERFDGTGYPDGLKGEEIPWLARLLAVAVAYAENRRLGPDAVEGIRLASGTAFDPEAVRALLRSLPHAKMPRREKEVLLSELKPGMVLAKGIYTANGMLLIPDGQQLTETYIDKLRNRNRISPITQSLFVYC